MPSLRCFIFATFLFLLSLDLGGANRLPLKRRTGSLVAASLTTPAAASSTQPPLPSLSSSINGVSTSIQSSSVDSTSTLEKHTSLSTSSAASNQSYSKTTAASSTSILGAATPSVSIFNATLTPDDLPITPELTPAFAVAGVLLLASGLVYTFVGIRNKWLQTYFSAAYLASLSVTVLIVYVMELPVTNGLQGAYLVAITLTGLILGGAALLLMEMTEGLGSLLGGFCLAMWLLVLQPGGLLKSTASIVAFIVTFTMASWATSFSRHTRPYGLICLTSFGGATVVVLGIDCFTRSGLKEFWTYIWNLNQNLFPLGATTYPLTKGMKVEIFVVIVLFLAGMASQSKLWNIIKKRRERRALDRLHNERDLRQEEERVGRRVERANSRQRVYWEAVYGNKDPTTSADSGIGSIVKDGSLSTETSILHPSERPIEMAAISAPEMTGANQDQLKKESDSITFIKAVGDNQPTAEKGESRNQVAHATNELGRSSHLISVRNSQYNSNEEGALHPDSARAVEQVNLKRTSTKIDPQRFSAGPAIVPLPFMVSMDDGDNSSSVATFADDDFGSRFSKRFSQGSELLRSLSQRSKGPGDALSRPLSTSTEKLVGQFGAEDSRSSLAATVDDMTDDGDSRSLPDMSAPIPGDKKGEENMSGGVALHGTIHNIEQPPILGQKDSAMEHQGQTFQQMVSREVLDISLDDGPRPETLNSATPGSLPTALTKAVLPQPLPRVASSYRTNEWAKHLSNADTPEIDDIKLFQPPTEVTSTPEEAPAVVHVKGLQQTQNIGVTPLAPRNSSQLSSYPFPPQGSRTNSYQSLNSSRAEPTVVPWPQAVMSRSVSHQSLNRVAAQQMRLMRSYRNSSTPNISQALVESPIEGSPGGQSNSTSIPDKHENPIRDKSSIALTASSINPPADSFSPLDVRSRKIRDSRIDEEQPISISARRSITRQSTLSTLTPQLRQNSSFDSHQPRRQSTTPVNGPSKDGQLAQWRASVQQDLQSTVQPKKSLDKSRSALLQEKMIAERQKEMEQARKVMKENVLDERMRKGDMLEAHREAMRRMQMEANKHV